MKLQAELDKWTPLAAVLQDLVVKYLKPPATLLVADCGDHVIRAVSLDDFSVQTFAGLPSQSGHLDGERDRAKLHSPWSLAIHKPSNSLLVGEWDGGCVRRVLDGFVSTLCGSPRRGYREGSAQWNGMVLKKAMFLCVSGIAVVGESILVSDGENHVIRRIQLNAKSSLFAGTPGTPGFADSPAVRFHCPMGLTVGADGSVYAADRFNHSIRVISPTGRVATLAGGTQGYCDGVGGQAHFNNPMDVAWDGQDAILVADSGNSCVRSVHIATATTSTLAGAPDRAGYKDGLISVAKFQCPQGIAVDSSTGAVFVSCCDTVRRISVGHVTTVCSNEDGDFDTNLSFATGLALM